MKVLIRYPAFVLLLIQFHISAICTKDNAILWKRAREGSIDLNRTPSPEPSIDLNRSSPESPVKDTASTTTKKTRKRKREKPWTTNEQKDTDQAKERERVLEIRRKTQSRYRRRIWGRIRSGKARESDLRIREGARKSYTAWQKANREKMNAYQRKYSAKKRKLKEEEKKKDKNDKKDPSQ